MKSLISATRPDRSSAFSYAWKIYAKLNSLDQNLLFADTLRIGWFLVSIFAQLKSGKSPADLSPVYRTYKNGKLATWLRFRVEFVGDSLFVSLSGTATEEWDGFLRLSFDRWTGQILFCKFTNPISDRAPFNEYRSAEGDRLRAMQAEKREKHEIAPDYTAANFYGSNGRGTYQKKIA
jgi:hypothetical protein